MLTLDDLQRLPVPPRRLPWITRWYLLFHTPGSHLGWGIFCFILMLFTAAAPDFTRRLLPWNMLGDQVREATFTITAVDGSTDTSDEPSDSEPVFRYYYTYTDDRGILRRGDDTGERGGGYLSGQRVRGQYLRRLPSLSRIPDLHEPWEFSMVLVFTLLFLFPSVLIIAVALRLQTTDLRLLAQGKLARVEEDTAPAAFVDDPEAGMPSAAARFMAWNGTYYNLRTYRTSTAWVLYLPHRPEEHTVIPREGIRLPCRVDDRGRLRLLPGKALFVVALPTLYLFLPFSIASGWRAGLFIAAAGGVLLLLGLFQGGGMDSTGKGLPHNPPE